MSQNRVSGSMPTDMSPMRSLRALTILMAFAVLVAIPISAEAQTRDDVERTEEARDEAAAALVAVNAELNAALLEYQEINSSLEDLNWRITVLYDRVGEYEAEATDLEDRARSLVIDAYVNGGAELMNVALEAASIQDVLTSQVLISRATEHDIVDLDRLDAVSREMGRLSEQLARNQAEVETLRDEAQAVVDRLDAAQAAASTAYAEADREAREAYAAWQAAERRRKLAELTRRQGAGGGLSPAATPGFVCPVKGQVGFINDWGFPRSGGRTHKGTDMFASRGTPLVAVGNGSVRLYTNNLGGTVARVNTDYGFSFYYAHMDGYAPGIKSGQRVSTGQTIGYVGNTGNAIGTSPHLHFQIHPGGGAPVNPYPTVRYYCG